ncbi:glycosyltransferase family 4 protein [Bacillus sp. 7894-2]|uniref:glycosyltransferase family 4 protein n=1 Tax=Bacillus sp. 7894-2 TaxID=2021695 RepID=UPI000BA5FE8D|nr:glycosyltransferase family 4 protein [Bacillus sp. 7894-2]PAE25787.1 hypothetical protein CHI10_05760 [Bacillus sp. 7894-2]
MNIWIVSTGEPLPVDEGNPRLRRMGMLSTILSEQGHEVHWFSSTFHHYKKKHRYDCDTNIAYKENLTIHLIKTNGYKKNISLQRILLQRNLANKFIKNTKNYKKPDIIIATMAPLQLSKAVVNFGKKNNIPTIVDIRDLWPEIYKEVVPKWGNPLIRPYIWFSKKQLECILKESTSIIGVTPNFLEYGLEVAGIKQRRFDKVFYTSYKPRNFYSELDNFEKHWSEHGLKKEDFIVVFLGNFGRQFILEPIVEAANKLKDNKNIKFVLCGTGESLDKIKILSEGMENLVLPGWIEEEQILSLLAASSIGIAPYRNSINFTKNTPNKFGEYLSASLPVFLGLEGIMADLVHENQCGMTYKNSDELELNIKKLYLDRKLLHSMSANAKRLFNEKFNSDKVYLELADHIRNIKMSFENKKGVK